MVTSGNQCPIFLFCHPQHLASIIKSNFGPRWLNTLLISNRRRKERIKKKCCSFTSTIFYILPFLPTRIWSLWGWYLLCKLFTGDSLVLNKYLPNEWMNDQILPLFVFSLRRQEPALLKIIQQVCFEAWLSTQVFWWKAHPLSTKTC